MKAFIADWNDTKTYTSLARLSVRYKMSPSELAHKASELRGKGHTLACRKQSRVSDIDLMHMYRNIDKYPTVKSISTAINLDMSGLLVRVSKLRTLHGTDKVPYRGVHQGKVKPGKVDNEGRS